MCFFVYSDMHIWIDLELEIGVYAVYLFFVLSSISFYYMFY